MSWIATTEVIKVGCDGFANRAVGWMHKVGLKGEQGYIVVTYILQWWTNWFGKWCQLSFELGHILRHPTRLGTTVWTGWGCLAAIWGRWMMKRGKKSRANGWVLFGGISFSLRMYPIFDDLKLRLTRRHMCSGMKTGSGTDSITHASHFSPMVTKTLGWLSWGYLEPAGWEPRW